LIHLIYISKSVLVGKDVVSGNAKSEYYSTTKRFCVMISAYRMHLRRANSRRTNIKPAIPTSGNWRHLVNTHHCALTKFIHVTLRASIWTFNK